MVNLKSLVLNKKVYSKLCKAYSLHLSLMSAKKVISLKPLLAVLLLKMLDELTTGKLNNYQLGKAYGINASQPLTNGLKNTINLHNEIRVRVSLDFKTPNYVHKYAA